MPLAWSSRLPIMTAALFVAACHPYAEVDSKFAAGANIRIQFSEPTPLFVSQKPGDSLLLRDVSMAEGSVLFAVGDTLRLRLAHAHDAAGTDIAFATEATAVVVRAVGSRISTAQGRSRCPERVTLGVIAGMLFGLMLFYLVSPST